MQWCSELNAYVCLLISLWQCKMEPRLMGVLCRYLLKNLRINQIKYSQRDSAQWKVRRSLTLSQFILRSTRMPGPTFNGDPSSSSWNVSLKRINVNLTVALEKAKGSPKSLGYIVRDTRTSAQNFVAIHLARVKILHQINNKSRLLVARQEKSGDPQSH